MGRHYGVNMIATSTRASHLPPDYRSQATRVIAFRQSEPADIDYMEDIIGEKALRLPSLPRHEFIDWKESDAWEESPPEDEPEPEPEKIIVDKKPDLM